MSAVMDEESKRWTARRERALVLEVTQGKMTMADPSRQLDVPRAEIEE